MNDNGTPDEAPSSDLNAASDIDNVPNARRLAVAGAPSQRLLQAPPLELGTPFRGVESEDEGMDARHLLSLALRRWRLMAATLAIVLLAAGAYNIVTPPIYESQSNVLINISSGAPASFSGLPLLGSLLGSEQSRNLETEVEILRSSPVQEAALKQLSPQHQATLGPYRQVEITPLRSTNIVNLKVASRQPEASQALVKAIIAEYESEAETLHRRQVLDSTRYLREQLSQVRAQLDGARTALRKYKEGNKTVNLGTEENARIAALSEIESQLRQAQVERKASLKRVEQLQASAARIAPLEKLPASIVRRPAVTKMQDKLTQLQLDLIAAQKEFVSGSPEVQAIKTEIESLQAEMKGEAQTEVSAWTQNPDPIRRSMLQEAAQAQSDVWAQDARRGALEQAQQEMKRNLMQLPGQQYRLSQLETDKNAFEKTYEVLNTRYIESRITEERKLSTLRAITPASADPNPVSPRRMRNMMLACVLGTMLALGLARVVDRNDDRVHSPEDAARASRLPVLAHIPFIRENSEQLLVKRTDSPSALLDGFRMLRANITFSSPDHPIRSVAITSSRAGEGKSTAALNLAVTAALSGKKVILVDADLRCPKIHTLLDLPNKSGLSHVLAGDIALREALQQSQAPNLRVLTSGFQPANPFEMLDSQAARNCFEAIFAEADFVVIDVPPAQSIADAQVVSTLVDATLLVISPAAGKREIARTCELLAQARANLAGSILTKLPTGRAGQYYN